MKWFKHISDSLDDPFIDEILDEFGDFGYLAFFGILEIYGREFKIKKEWFLSVRLEYLRRKFHRKSVKSVSNFLASDLINKKWSVKLNGRRADIYIPKFTDLIDETTKKKLRAYEHKNGRGSGSVPESLRTKDKDKEEDKEVRTEADPSAGHFSDKIEDKKVVDVINAISEMLWTFSSGNFNAWAFVQKKANTNGHPLAIRDSLAGVLKVYQNRQSFKKSPQALAEHIFKKINGNFNEADFVAEAEKLKTIKPPTQLAALIGNIGG